MWRFPRLLALGAAGCLISLLSGCAPPTLPVRLPSPAVVEPGHESGVFVGSHGTKLFEQSWHPKGEPRAVVVIHHGLKSHSDEYAVFAHELVALGYAVYAYDMRGHGRSEGMRAALDDFDDLTGDLAIFMDRVAAREPGRPIFLAGHSVGGAVVTLFTIEHHPHLAGLILLAPAIRVAKPPIVAASIPLTATLLPNFPAVDVPDAAFSRDPARRAEMAADPLIYHPPGPARTAAGLLDALEHIWGAAEQIDVPLLALHGTADEATDPRGSVEIVRRAHSQDKKLVLYRGLYHDLLHEPEREAVAHDITTWIEAHTPSALVSGK